MDSLIVISVLLCFSFVSCTHYVALEKPEDLSEEMYCMGCEIVVKELDSMLGRKPTRGMGETVTRALRQVCKLEAFKKYEADAQKVLDVCNHIKGDEGMEAVLITEYSHKHEMGKRTTYLDMTHMICGTVIKACRAPSILMNDENNGDGGIAYDADTEQFTIKQGRKVRTPKPVAPVLREPTERANSATPVRGEKLVHVEMPDPVQGEDKLTREPVAVFDGDSHDEL